jgi:hypothetical protein
MELQSNFNFVSIRLIVVIPLRMVAIGTSVHWDFKVSWAQCFLNICICSCTWTFLIFNKTKQYIVLQTLFSNIDSFNYTFHQLDLIITTKSKSKFKHDLFPLYYSVFTALTLLTSRTNTVIISLYLSLRTTIVLQNSALDSLHTRLRQNSLKTPCSFREPHLKFFA